MLATCILTDSSVQFPNNSSLNFDHLVVIPHHLVIDGVSEDETRDAHTLSKLVAETAPSKIVLGAPTCEDFRQTLSTLSQKYHSIIVILLSSHLSPAFQNASEAIYQLKGAASIQVIDSQTIGAGLGMLVQVAIDALQRGETPLQINRVVRGMVPHIYTVFCLQSLQSLAHSGHLDPAQAALGEMLGVIPLYVLDGGKLVPIQKARSSRQLVDVLHEFVAEFNLIQHITLLQGIPPFEQEMRNLHDRLTQDFPVSLISEHTFGASIMALLGPRSIGVAVMEHGNQE